LIEILARLLAIATFSLKTIDLTEVKFIVPLRSPQSLRLHRKFHVKSSFHELQITFAVLFRRFVSCSSSEIIGSDLLGQIFHPPIGSGSKLVV
jgi:hypothetical protein